MNGVHPYQSRGKLVDDAPSIEAKIIKGFYPYEDLKAITPPDYAPPYSILPTEVQDLFHRCFVDGHKDREMRPTALDWLSTLERALKMKQCTKNSNHWFSNHLKSCPWCDIEKHSGKDYFPSPIGFQVGLDDAISSQDTLEKRKESLIHDIKIALVDGYLTEEEKSYIISVGEKLHLSKREIENLIEIEQKKHPKSSLFSKKTQIVSGTPKIQVKPRNFSFQSIKSGASVYGEIEISNIGSGILNGSVLSNRKYLTTSSSTIDTSKHVQIFNFIVDTNGLPLGLKDTATITISSNGGNAQIPIDLSIEIPEKAFERFNLIYLPTIYIVGGLLGLLSGQSAILLGFIGVFARQIHRVIREYRVSTDNLVVGIILALFGLAFWGIISAISFYISIEFGYILCGLLFASVFRFKIDKWIFTNSYARNSKTIGIMVFSGILSAFLFCALTLRTWTFIIGIAFLIFIAMILDLGEL